MDIKEERDMLNGMICRLLVDLCVTSDQEIMRNGSDAQTLLDLEDKASERILSFDIDGTGLYRVEWLQGDGLASSCGRSTWDMHKDFDSREEALVFAKEKKANAKWRVDVPGGNNNDVKDIKLYNVTRIQKF
jgi:hypothetical protein